MTGLTRLFAIHIKIMFSLNPLRDNICQSVIIQVMDLCRRLWPIFKHLPHALIMKEHYPYMCILFCPPFYHFEPKYYRFMQYKVCNNGDPLYVYTLFGEYPLFLKFCHFWCF
jgi:hypothetical protein